MCRFKFFHAAAYAHLYAFQMCFDVCGAESCAIQHLL